MSRLIRLFLLSVTACLLQTSLAKYVHFAGVSPDMMIAFLTLATDYTGLYGGFCLGSLVGLLYDASVGCVSVINLIAYPAIGCGCPFIRAFVLGKFKSERKRGWMELALICLFWVLAREILYIGYLFLIGANLEWQTTLTRMLSCSLYTTAMLVPCRFIVRFVMEWKPKRKAGGKEVAA